MESKRLDSLLQRAQQHDAAALTDLYDAYAPRVYGLLVRLTRSRDLAEDLLQETFLRMTRTIGEYAHDGRFEAWLFRIAGNLARDHVRRVQRRGSMASLDGSEAPDGGFEPADRHHEAPPAALDRAEAAEALAAAIDRLPPDDREIVLLRHYGELSFKEIAALLGVPLGTALARGHRALKKLKAYLTEGET